MKFRISPKTVASAIPYTELISKLQSEFTDRMSISDVSEPDVTEMVAELIELGSPQQMIDDARSGVTLRVSIYDFDFSDDYVTFDITPATVSLIGHYADNDTGTILGLLERCSKVLGYSLSIDT